MSHVLIFIIGFVLGGFCGILLMALVSFNRTIEEEEQNHGMGR